MTLCTGDFQQVSGSDSLLLIALSCAAGSVYFLTNGYLYTRRALALVENETDGKLLP